MAATRSEVRASGRTPADEAAAAESQELDTTVDLDGDPVDGGLTGGAVHHPENDGLSLTPAFSRMRTDWNSPDREIIGQMRRGADVLIMQSFGEVFDIFYEIYMLVREPVMKTGGEMETDAQGLPIWQKQPGTNSYIENWDRLTYREREIFLFKITAGILRWKQIAIDMWGEAMFARAEFEEAFSHGYEQLPGDKPTIQDRTARARRLSAEYRYHAVYTSYLSRKADGVIQSVELLGQRLKDVMVSV